jgi:hypothetical protein
MVERRVGNQRDLLAWLGVAKATPQRLALAGGGERMELVAVTVFAGAADDVEAGGLDRVHEQSVRVLGGHAVSSSFVDTVGSHQATQYNDAAPGVVRSS